MTEPVKKPKAPAKPRTSAASAAKAAAAEAGARASARAKKPAAAAAEAAAPAPDPTAARLAAALATAQRIAAVAQDKLAEDVLLLDMSEFCSFTDAFVIASGRTTRQVKAIADEVLEKLRQEQRLFARSVAGERDADWIVIDFVDVVVHVFTPEQRQFYRLEELWSDVPRVAVEAPAAAPEPAPNPA